MAGSRTIGRRLGFYALAYLIGLSAGRTLAAAIVAVLEVFYDDGAWRHVVTAACSIAGLLVAGIVAYRKLRERDVDPRAEAAA